MKLGNGLILALTCLFTMVHSVALAGPRDLQGETVRGTWKGSLRVKENSCDSIRSPLKMHHAVLAANGTAYMIFLEDRNLKVNNGAIRKYVQAVSEFNYISRRAFSAVTVNDYVTSPGVHFLASYTYQNITNRRANVRIHYALRDNNYNMICQKIWEGAAQKR